MIMLYGPIRTILAGIVLSPFIFSSSIRKKFKGKKGVYITSICCAIFVLSLLLYQWPLENQLGGFRTVERAIEYKYGSCELHYSIESDDSVLVLTNRTSEILHTKNSRFFLVSSIFLNRKDAFASGVDVVIYGDNRDLERFVQIAILQNSEMPETIFDNKGIQFRKGYTNNGITYFIGSFQDDGLDYVLFINDVDVGLVEVN